MAGGFALATVNGGLFARVLTKTGYFSILSTRLNWKAR